MTDQIPSAAPAGQFRKKPVVIEAVQFTQALRDAVVLDGVPCPAGVQRGAATWHQGDRKVWRADFYVETLEGRMRVELDDWIITGVKGEHYPCKPDIFAATYEPAATPTPAPAVPQTAAAWAHQDDPERVISAVQRERALRDGGASASSVRPYSVPPGRIPSPVATDPKWDGAEEWMPLAWALCAEENGEEACNELVWEGGPVPEPWGDRWLKYEDEAKRLITLVRKHAPQAPSMADIAAHISAAAAASEASYQREHGYPSPGMTDHIPGAGNMVGDEIGRIALALAKDGNYRHRAAEDLLALQRSIDHFGDANKMVNPLPAGWKFNHARQPDPDEPGTWEIGWLDDEDDRFSPIITVDTGLYYQDQECEPLARAILARLDESHQQVTQTGGGNG